jgi:squalene synthase HpnC
MGLEGHGGRPAPAPVFSAHHATLSRERGENFPVAPRVLPRQLREDLHAVYAFARTVDDLGDRALGDREALLRAFGDDLSRIWSAGAPHDPVLQRLLPTVRRHGLPEKPFQLLVAANQQDQVVVRYPTFADLVGYCELSANPVGRIVLDVFGCSTPLTRQLSDRVCTALQLIEHAQDVSEDARDGRIYVPQEDLAAFGVDETALTIAPASDRVRALMRVQVERAAAMLDDGAPLTGLLTGWARLAVAGYVAGGRAAVDALRRSQGDVVSAPATPRTRDLARHLVAELTYRRLRRSKRAPA